MEKFSKACFLPADILIPKDADMEKWSVVACDQYTSQPEYWDEVEKLVGSHPSTLNITFPEIYLEKVNTSEKIASINKTMRGYLSSGIFKLYKNSFIYVERRLPGGKIRRGIVGAVDLEAYDYMPGSNSKVRATEKTVLERIPPRVNIRIDAPLELPHVMLLIDDSEKTVIEPLADNKDSFERVYDFELMQNGGHITGYHVTCEKAGLVADGLLGLADKSDFLYAVGDGNHSLAAAKECWERVKKTLSAGQEKNHRARYALAELVNIHDESLVFEPIHRVVFNCNPADLTDALVKFYNTSYDCTEGQAIKYTYAGKNGEIYINNPPSPLVLATLQAFLDDYAAKNGCTIDYIHGADVVEKLSAQKNAIGFLLPAMEKSELFPCVSADGVLPRKTFSMGEANEKRYYLECREIK